MAAGGASLGVGIRKMATLLFIQWLILAYSSSVVSATPAVKVHSYPEFHDILASNQRAIVSFTANWCGPCREMKPTFQRLSEDTPGVAFIIVDVDEVPDAADVYGVNAMPTFTFFERGAKFDELISPNPESLQEKVSQFAARGLTAAD